MLVVRRQHGTWGKDESKKHSLIGNQRACHSAPDCCGAAYGSACHASSAMCGSSGAISGTRPCSSAASVVWQARRSGEAGAEM